MRKVNGKNTRRIVKYRAAVPFVTTSFIARERACGNVQISCVKYCSATRVDASSAGSIVPLKCRASNIS